MFISAKGLLLRLRGRLLSGFQLRVARDLAAVSLHVSARRAKKEWLMNTISGVLSRGREGQTGRSELSC